MQVNPSSVAFSQDKRTTERDTREGKIFFQWANQSGRNDDVLRMEFNGQTGNIGLRTGTRGSGFVGASQSASAAGDFLNTTLADISGTTDSAEPGKLRAQGANVDTSGASKLLNFHNLWSLTHEPVLDAVTGLPVYYYITYASPLFGNSLITFVGHFSRSFTVTDDSAMPMQRRYSFGFVAHGSYPSFSHLYALIAQSLSSTFINPLQG
jgi:hypothetical protein